jgi:hypothetical protein
VNKLLVSEHSIYPQWSLENILDPTKTVIGSHKKALWVCKNSHTFEMSVRNRINGIECSYCSGKKKTAGVNDLKALHPEIFAELSPNNTSDLTEIAPCSNKSLLWVCSKDHEYSANPNHRVVGTDCPYCSNRRLLKGFNDLSTTNPELLNNWDFEKNIHKPIEVFAKAKHKYWWICSEGHSYNMPGGKRIEGRGCPYCNKGVLLSGFNDLATRYPEVANDWDHDKNELTPHQIIAGSGFKAWWRCEKDHSWKASISNRTSKKSGCPDCSKRVSRGELEVRKFAEILLGKESISSSRKIIKPYELDIYFPDEKLAIEFNGTFWHSDSQIRVTHDISAKQYHQTKIDLCSDKTIDLLFVWQIDWESHPDKVKSAIREFTNDRKTIPDVLNKLESEVQK